MKAMKKVLAMVLALAMIVTAVPVTNAAADTANLKAGKTVSKTYYAGRIHTLKLNGVKASDITKTTWKSNNTAVVKCITDTKTKTSTNIRCVKKGTATVTAKVTLKNKKTKTYKAKITVKATKLEVAQEEVSLKVGENKQLTVTYQPKSAKVTYSSNNTGVATVSKGNIVATGEGETWVNVKLTCGKKNITRVVKVKVEKPDEGLTAKLTNPVVEALPNTILVNDDAIINVQYVQNGKPVAGKTVMLKIDTFKSMNRGAYYIASPQQITDELGVATFVITRNYTGQESYQNANRVSRLFVTASVPSDAALSAECTVDFAAVTMTHVTASGNVVGTNFSDRYPNTSGIINTSVMYDPSDYRSQYVMSQQVSNAGKADHAVTFNGGYPILTLPKDANDLTAATRWTDTEAYHKTEKYGVYTTDTYIYKLKELPNELEMATLNFTDVNISAHTRMRIRTYSDAGCANDGDGHQLNEKVYNGPLKDENFGYQVPGAENYSGLWVRIDIESAGQVDLAMNDGYTLKDVDYVLKKRTAAGTSQSKIPGSDVVWGQIDSYYTAEETLRNVPANVVVPAGGYVTRKIPVFPRQGNAILTVYDINGKVVAHYAQNTKNGWWDTVIRADGTIVGEDLINKNVPGGIQNNVDTIRTYRIREDEVEDLAEGVATIKNEDGKVTVDSEVPGRLTLKGEVTVPAAYKNLLDATNDYVYTFVQWNEVPFGLTTNNSFDALIGQEVEVYAQLYGANGNKVAKDNVIVHFYGDEDVVASNNQVLNGTEMGENTGNYLGKASVIDFDRRTDDKGQARLLLKATDYTELLNLHAVSTDSRYHAEIVIKNKAAGTAVNLYWIGADISFTPSRVVGEDTTERMTDGTPLVRTYDVNPNAGTAWEYGFQVKGLRKRWDADHNRIAEDRPTIGGLDLHMDAEQGSIGTVTAMKDRDNVVKAESKFTGRTIIVGKIDDKSVTKELTGINYAGKGQTDVLRRNYNLRVLWGADGLDIVPFYANGYKIYNPAAANVTETIYVKVTDKGGDNPRSGEKVVFSLKNANGAVATGVSSGGDTLTPVAADADSVYEVNDDGVMTGVIAYTDNEGIARVDLTHTTVYDANGLVDTAYTVIAVRSDSLQGAKALSYTWVGDKAININGGLTLDPRATSDRTAYKTNYANGVVTLMFYSDVVASSVCKEMFKVQYDKLGDGYDDTNQDGDVEATVSDVTVNGKVVTLKLKENLPYVNTARIVVTMTDGTVCAGSRVAHYMTSTDGARYTDSSRALLNQFDTIFTIDLGSTPTTVGAREPRESRQFVGLTAITAAAFNADVDEATDADEVVGETEFEVPVTTVVGTETAKTVWTSSDADIVTFVEKTSGLYGAAAPLNSSASLTGYVYVKAGTKTGTAVLTATTTYKETRLNANGTAATAATVKTVVTEWLVTVVGGKFTSIVKKTATTNVEQANNQAEILAYLGQLTLVPVGVSGTDTIQIGTGVDISAVTNAGIKWTIEDGTDPKQAVRITNDGAKDSGDIIGEIIENGTEAGYVVTLTVTVTYWNDEVAGASASNAATESRSWKVIINSLGKIRSIDPV